MPTLHNNSKKSCGNSKQFLLFWSHHMMMISCLTMKTGLLTKIAGTYFTICASKCTLNSTNQLTASEAAEAGLTWPKTSALMSRGCMQSFNHLALKLRPCIGDFVSWCEACGAKLASLALNYYFKCYLSNI